MLGVSLSTGPVWSTHPHAQQRWPARRLDAKGHHSDPAPDRQCPRPPKMAQRASRFHVHRPCPLTHRGAQTNAAPDAGCQDVASALDRSSHAEDMRSYGKRKQRVHARVRPGRQFERQLWPGPSALFARASGRRAFLQRRLAQAQPARAPRLSRGSSQAVPKETPRAPDTPGIVSARVGGARQFCIVCQRIEAQEEARRHPDLRPSAATEDRITARKELRVNQRGQFDRQRRDDSSGRLAR